MQIIEFVAIVEHATRLSAHAFVSDSSATKSHKRVSINKPWCILRFTPCTKGARKNFSSQPEGALKYGHEVRIVGNLVVIIYPVDIQRAHLEMY
jgi:hypothetical protein